MNKTGSRAERAVSSMQWAAWADALGWISELTTEENVKRRTKGRPLTEPYSWRRQIGGRSGVRVELPAGCYSDDTQLRLATARSVSTHGFDVEAFARVELPVWQSYALGGGRATKAAAAGMSKQNATWAANFYRDWENSGGNGAAMRIQPHVYAATELLAFDHLDDVIKNAVVTHGHPNALVGAVLHATALTIAMAEYRAPGPEQWSDVLDICHGAFVAYQRCPELSAYWRPRWESVVDASLEHVWDSTIQQAALMFDASTLAYNALRAASDQHAAAHAYELLVDALDLDDERTRGSGLSTSIAAVVLAAALPEHPAQSAILAASRLNTDTDTIATMAAAIVAAASPRQLASEVLDATYIANEARRLTSIALGEPTEDFPYPDLLHWVPPKSGLDSVGLANDELALAGLGLLAPRGSTYSARAADWQWMATSFGATVLVKHRPDPRPLPPNNWPVHRVLEAANRPERFRSAEVEGKILDEGEALFELPAPDLISYDATIDDMSITEMLAWVKRRGYTDLALGYALRRVIQIGTPMQRSEFVEALSRELKVRDRRRHA